MSVSLATPPELKQKFKCKTGVSIPWNVPVKRGEWSADFDLISKRWPDFEKEPKIDRALQ